MYVRGRPRQNTTKMPPWDVGRGAQKTKLTPWGVCSMVEPKKTETV